MSTAISQITRRFGNSPPAPQQQSQLPTQQAQQPQKPFQSSVTWKPADWKQPLTDLVNRIQRAAWLHPNKPLNSTDQEPIDFTEAQHQILFSGQAALEQARAANDMPRFRRIIGEYEQKAIGFLNENRVKRLETAATS